MSDAGDKLANTDLSEQQRFVAVRQQIAQLDAEQRIAQINLSVHMSKIDQLLQQVERETKDSVTISGNESKISSAKFVLDVTMFGQFWIAATAFIESIPVIARLLSINLLAEGLGWLVGPIGLVLASIMFLFVNSNRFSGHKSQDSHFNI